MWELTSAYPVLADDYSAFNAVWDKPEGGLQGYLVRFLESTDPTFQHIAVWTCVQLLDSGEPALENHIRSSESILPLVMQLASAADGSTAGDQSTAGDAEDNSEVGDSGEIEIATLAKRVVELLGVDPPTPAT